VRYVESTWKKEGLCMSENVTFWVTLAEKFVGFLLAIVGALLLYFTATSTDALGVFTGLFGFLGIVLLVVGVFLLLVRPPE
jgi:hypothetical protein